MAETKVYALDEGKNQRETMTKEQIITAIQNMAATGSPGDVDAGFITKILELNKQGLLRFWVGTMAEYNALEKKEDGVLYLFSDDPTVDDLEAAIGELGDRVEALGFKKGAVSYSGDFGTPTANSLTKQGKMALLSFCAPLNSASGAFRLTLPAEFRPAEPTEIGVKGTQVDESDGSMTIGPAYYKVTVPTNGVIDLSDCVQGGAIFLGMTIEINNAGWRLA